MKPRLKRVPVEGKPILSAQVCNSDQLFRDIVRLYFHPGWTVVDLTWGRGVFWKKVDTSQFNLIKSDIGNVEGIDVRMDATKFNMNPGSVDAFIFDPPYLYVGGLKTLKDSINRGYRNKERGFAGVEQVDKMYFDFLDCAWRILKPGGLVVLKHMTQVMASVVRPGPIIVYNYAMEHGWLLLDWMINVAPSTPTIRWPYQQHSRRNYSDWLILMKGD